MFNLENRFKKDILRNIEFLSATMCRNSLVNCNETIAVNYNTVLNIQTCLKEHTDLISQHNVYFQLISNDKLLLDGRFELINYSESIIDQNRHLLALADNKDYHKKVISNASHIVHYNIKEQIIIDVKIKSLETQIFLHRQIADKQVKTTGNQKQLV